MLFNLFFTLPLLATASASHSNKNSRVRHNRAAAAALHANDYEIAERAQLEVLESEAVVFNNATIEKRGDAHYGTGTYFYVGLGACGQYSKDSDYMVALNWQLYGGGYPGPQCFKYITIQANGVTVGGVEILDECPSCPNTGDLDLSPGLFNRFADFGAGTIQMTWWFNDGSSGPTTTSETPTSTWVAPTSTWSPPSSTTQAYVAPSTTPTSTWSPSPSPSTSIQPISTATSITTSSASSSISAPMSTITSSSYSISNSSTSASANPYAVISSYAASGSESASSASSSGIVGEVPGNTGESALPQGNLIALNALVAQYGNLVVQGAEMAL